MKKCRHCRTDNEDGATICAECGLDFSPSAAGTLISRLPSAFRALDTRWLWRSILIIGLSILLLALYLLSFGPILRFYGAKPATVSSRVPSAIRAIYKPLDSFLIPERISRLLYRYNQWWMGVYSDREKLAALISQVDRSITNGMPQSQVVGLLGRPNVWDTNENMVRADFWIVPLGANFYGTITSGFTITFTNGAVFEKSPILFGSH